MTALADNKEVIRKDPNLIAHPVVASDIIYKGALTMINAAGHLAPCAAGAGCKFAGVAYEKADNSAGAAAAINCKVEKSGRFLLDGSGFAQANVGDKVYATDDATITLVQAVNTQFVGVIDEYVSSSQVWVNIEPAVAQALGEFKVVYAGEFTTVGGDAVESIVQAGILASDIALVTIHTVGGTPRTILTSLAAADAITVTMSGDPSTDHVLSYVVLRAA